MGRFLAGLDIGGTKTAVLLVDQELNVRARTKTVTQVSDPQSLVAGIAAAIHEALQLAGVPSDRLAAIGAGIPGRVVAETGEVQVAVNLNIDSYPVGPELEELFEVPVVLMNDVRAAALGAYDWLQGLQPVSHMAYMSIGTGIAAALVVDGRIYHGARAMAGEIGHTIFEPHGPMCVCGMAGCLEAIASGPAIARQWQESCPAVAGDGVTAKSVYAAATQGQPQATAVIQHVSEALARAVYLLVNLYDVEKVVLGGGVTGAGPAFVDPIFAALDHMRAQSALVRSALPPGMLVALPPGHDAATWGAIKLAQQAL